MTHTDAAAPNSASPNGASPNRAAPNRSGPPARRRGCLLPGILIVVVLATAARLAAPWFVRTQVLPGVGRAAGLRVACEDVSLGVLAGRATLTGLTVTGDAAALGATHPGADAAGELLRAGSVSVNGGITSLFGGAPVLDELVIDDAHARIVVLEDGSTNLDRILEAHRAGTGPGAALQDVLPGLVIRSLRATRCTVTIVDPARRGATGTDMNVRDIEVHGTDVVLGTTPADAPPMTLDLDAVLTQQRDTAAISAIAWTQPGTAGTADTPLFVHAALTDLDLTSFPQYVDDTQRRLLGADRIDVVLSAGARGGKFTQGAVVGAVPGRSEPLSVKFSGDVANPTVDGSGSLAALFELPFARCGHVGSVVWETGSAAVGGAAGLVENLAKGDVRAAGGSVLDGIGGALRAAGGGLAGAARGLGSLLGVPGAADGSTDGSRDPAAIHRALRAGFVTLRDRALGQTTPPR